MKITVILIAIIISVLFLTSAVIQPWNDSKSITLTVNRGYEGNNESVLVNYSVSSSSYTDPIRIVLIPLDNYEPLPIFIFSEQDKYSVQNYSRVLGLYDHLRAEMVNLGLQQTVELVDRLGVMEVLNGKPSPDHYQLDPRLVGSEHQNALLDYERGPDLWYRNAGITFCLR
jgi:hypothetical protein